MLPDRVSNPGPLTYESGALPIALRGPACFDARTAEFDKNLLTQHCLCLLPHLVTQTSLHEIQNSPVPQHSIPLRKVDQSDKNVKRCTKVLSSLCTWSVLDYVDFLSDKK